MQQDSDKKTQYIPSLTGERKNIDDEKNEGIEIFNAEENIASLQKIQISEYKKEANRPFLKIINNGAQEFHNWSKIALIALGSAGQAVLVVEGSNIATYILAGATCIGPIIADFAENSKLVNAEIIKNKDVKGWLGKLIEVSKFIWPGYGAFLVGAASIGLHMGFNSSSPLASNIILAAGTFVSGTAQMYINPRVRKAVAAKNLEDLQVLKIDDPELVKLMGEKIEIEIDKIKASIGNNPALEIIIKTAFEDIPEKLKELQKDIDGNHERALEFVELSKQIIVLKNLENKNLAQDNKQQKENVVKLEEDNEKQKEDFEKELYDKNAEIRVLKDKVKFLNGKLETKQEQNSVEEANVEKYKRRSSSEISITL